MPRCLCSANLIVIVCLFICILVFGCASDTQLSKKVTVQRFGSIGQIRPDQYAEYKRLHADTWPEVLKMISACNLRNYSIYHKDGALFTYVEYVGEDFAGDMAKMAADPTIRKWWALVVPMFKGADAQTPAADVWVGMEEIFHLD